MELASSALGYVASAVFHAAVHVAGHEAFHTFRGSLDRRLLRNHDVAQALRESFRASLRIVEDLYEKSESDGSRLESAKAAFKRIRIHAADLFTQPEGAMEDGPPDKVLTKDWSPSEALTDEVIGLAQPTDDNLEAFLRTSFAPAFKYAFVELGLKRSTSVRAVMMHGILQRVEDSVHQSNQRIDELRRALEQNEVESHLQTEMRLLEERLHVSSRKADAIIDGIAEVRESQRRLIESIEHAKLGEGVLRGYVLTCGSDGYPLVCRRVYKRDIRVGRDEQNDIVLPGRTVSAHHVLVAFEASHARVRDLGSKNGTFIGGVPIEEESLVSFGTEIVVGDYILVLHGPGKRADTLPTLSSS